MRARGVWTLLKQRVSYEKQPSKIAGLAQDDHILTVDFDDGAEGHAVEDLVLR